MNLKIKETLLLFIIIFIPSISFSIEPKEGLLVLFPSYLYHSVDLNRSGEERIVISFNINLI